ncbi:MAG: SCO6745 family protein [Microthrixaceae bacterium]
MEPVMARKMWRTLEPYHGLIYFAPEAEAEYAALGIVGRDGYFASRAAALGVVPAEVVIATFFNFSPALVRHAIPAAWASAPPERIVAARLRAVDAALRRALGDVVDGPDVARAAELARVAADACAPEGRALFAAHASLPWPTAPHLALWHAVSLLREFRGDGHLAALIDAELDGLGALVVHAASGEVPRAVLQSTRGWADAEWDASASRLAQRGLVDSDGQLTAAGVVLRARVEDRTDALAVAPWQELGDAGCEELRALVRPWSKAIVASGTFGTRPGR